MYLSVAASFRYVKNVICESKDKKINNKLNLSCLFVLILLETNINNKNMIDISEVLDNINISTEIAIHNYWPLFHSYCLKLYRFENFKPSVNKTVILSITFPRQTNDLYLDFLYFLVINIYNNGIVSRAQISPRSPIEASTPFKLILTVSNNVICLHHNALRHWSGARVTLVVKLAGEQQQQSHWGQLISPTQYSHVQTVSGNCRQLKRSLSSCMCFSLGGWWCC